MIFRKDARSETLRLRLWFLLPLAGVLTVAVLLIEALIHREAVRDLDRHTEEASVLAAHLYRDQIEFSASMLGAAMAVFATDKALLQGLAQRDRSGLLLHSAPLFSELKKKYGITHFYFSDARRVNILRVHQPERFGDTIDRMTTLQAEQTRKTGHGIELGPLGTFTLRLVSPWFGADGALLGYVELGMEIDHVLRAVQQLANVKTFVLIGKQFLDRRQWEEGMRLLGRVPDWEQFPDVVVNIQATENMPQNLFPSIRRNLSAEQTVMEPLVSGISAYRAVIQPLKDAAGRNVGRMVLLVDVSPHVMLAEELTRKSLWVGGIASGTLLSLFFWLTGVVGRRLERDQERLRELATRDGLTGLFNHRMHYVWLDGEFARSLRTGKPISLLLLDVDHFKQINDRYGHLAGDMALKGISDLVAHACRVMDIPCRYGGEEITVILPETDTDRAMIAAERLRKAVEDHAFDLGGSKNVHITVSIGVATTSTGHATSTELTDGADRALYRAKEQGRNRVVCAEQNAEPSGGSAPHPGAEAALPGPN